MSKTVYRMILRLTAPEEFAERDDRNDDAQ
ncbi:hypothetical protein F7D09_1755 [Bifidobacterium leontopitheci]|uniref:Uncharacterized protein n=1 Tax=Bifidobacterium leontopitheci TaxID=2650774 RepID=A0A6I1GK65_9BIFI|nr:hypothetical protein F7D09_1755 [Bifidobacterium leontopitheci]